MKRLVCIILSALALCVGVTATERVFVSTDRNIYIAGDEVWCSLFCVDSETGRFSHFSAVAYLELISDDGTVVTAKTGLMEGRGAGRFIIPASAPTGNYRLVAYTALNVNEEGEGRFCGSKLLSVFNTTSPSRVKDGVNVISDALYQGLPRKEAPTVGTVSATVNSRGGNLSVLINNPGPAATLSVSVFHVDDIVPPENGGIDAFLQSVKGAPSSASSNKRTPEYEGEIIYAAVEGLEKEALDIIEGVSVATLSAAGSPSDVYVGKVYDKGRIAFFTNNIYGDRELVCELNTTSGYKGHISLADNFIYPSPGNIPALPIAKSLFSSLVNRKAARSSAIQADTLVSFLPRRQDGLIESLEKKGYHLDDYNRFPTMEELIREILREVRVRERRGKDILTLTTNDASGSKKIEKENIMVMLDGVVISDYSIIEKMDAMLIDDVDLYLQSFAIGTVSFEGAINFITGKNYVTAVNFPQSVRVTDFKGVSFPVAYTGRFNARGGEDYRQLLYWHPLLEAGAGQSIGIQLTAPSYTGTFAVSIQGISEDGSPVRFVTLFDIN